MNGAVKSFSDLHGYGFIRGEDGLDYFVHQTHIDKQGYRTLYASENVCFEFIKTPRGLQARNVKSISQEHIPEQLKAIEKIQIRKNPFTPQDPIFLPSKFAGRNKEIIIALQSLIDGENLLIQGPRGIGKSSFSQQIVKVLSGNFELLEKNNIDTSFLKLNNITCSYRCVPGDKLTDIANALIKTLLYEITGKLTYSDTSKTYTISERGTEYSILNEKSQLSLTEVANDFTLLVKKIFTSSKNDYTGVTFLIDEIDVLDKDILIAPFLKSVCESLSGSNHAYSFILCGVTGIVTRLIREHRSSNRLFHPIELDQFSHDEIFELINLALDGTEISIEQDALKRISYLSNRFPHPAQQLGYFSFHYRNSNLIQYSDVEKAKIHITTRIKNQEFTTKWTKFKESAQSQVLQVMASDERENYSITWIKNELKTLSHDQVLGALLNLNKEDILDRAGSDRTLFAFREPLFKIYLQWAYQID